MSNDKLNTLGLPRAITSREYKLMLYPANFMNQEEDANKLWKDIKKIIKKNKSDDILIENQYKLKIKKTKYLDTPDRLLQRNNFIFRHRKDHDDKNYKITLKYRDTDRYIYHQTLIFQTA